MTACQRVALLKQILKKHNTSYLSSFVWLKVGGFMDL